MCSQVSTTSHLPVRNRLNGPGREHIPVTPSGFEGPRLASDIRRAGMSSADYRTPCPRALNKKGTHKQLACVAHAMLIGPHLTNHRRAQAPAMTFERDIASRSRTNSIEVSSGGDQGREPDLNRG